MRADLLLLALLSISISARGANAGVFQHTPLLLKIGTAASSPEYRPWAHHLLKPLSRTPHPDAVTYLVDRLKSKGVGVSTDIQERLSSGDWETPREIKLAGRFSDPGQFFELHQLIAESGAGESSPALPSAFMAFPALFEFPVKIRSASEAQKFLLIADYLSDSDTLHALPELEIR